MTKGIKIGNENVQVENKIKIRVKSIKRKMRLRVDYIHRKKEFGLTSRQLGTP